MNPLRAIKLPMSGQKRQERGVSRTNGPIDTGAYQDRGFTIAVVTQ
jgi:hypothetical protein